MKTMLFGIAACVALAVVADADASVRYHKHRHAPVFHDFGAVPYPAPPPAYNEVERGLDYGGHVRVPAPAYPIIQDCAHVTFPQCDGGS